MDSVVYFRQFYETFKRKYLQRTNWDYLCTLKGQGDEQ